MKWFKLDSDFYNDNRVLECKQRYGKDAFMLWIHLLGMLAEQWNGEPNKKFFILKSKLCSFAGIKPFKLRTFVECFENVFGMIIEQNENNLIINYPKFLKKQSSYFRGVVTKTHSLQEYKNRIEENRKEIHKEKKPVKKKPKKDEAHKADALRLLEFLNKESDRQLKPVKINLDPIIARLKEGYSTKDISGVMFYKINMDKFFSQPEKKHLLKPETLCRASKFPNYLEEVKEYEKGVQE